MLDEFVNAIYGGFDVENSIEPTMWQELTKIMNDATAKGLSKGEFSIDHNRSFLDAVKHANEIFAAFKTHAMGKSMASKLIDDNGRLKPFDKWMKDISSISSHHVGSWLKTEYNTAVLRAHNAADWRSFVENKDIMPNLRWMPTTSPDAEAVHRGYWEKKLTLPVEHSFWNKHHPGDRWNCKCSLESTDDPASPDDILDDLPIEPAQRGLENSPGKDGKMFNDTHPYFPKNCNQCRFYKNRGFKNKVKTWFINHEKDCYKCEFINESLPDKVPIEINKTKELIQEVEETKRSRGRACKIAELSNIETEFIKRKGIKLESVDIYMSERKILHALRDAKAAHDATVSKEELHFFLENINNKRKCSLYWHKQMQNLTYVTRLNGGVQKFIVELNYRLKVNRTKSFVNAFITAGQIDASNINEEYEKIR